MVSLFGGVVCVFLFLLLIIGDVFFVLVINICVVFYMVIVLMFLGYWLFSIGLKIIVVS